MGVPYLVGDEKFYFKDGNLVWLRNFNDVLPEFVYYWLKSPGGQNAVKLHTIGSTQQALTIDALKKFKIKLPKLDQQRRIVSVISSLEKKLSINKKINANLQQQAQAIFKSWFVDFEPFQDGEFVESELGPIPQGWRAGSIYEIANIIYGAPFSSKLFNSNREGKPIIRIRDLKNQISEVYTTEIHPKGYLLRAGDIVVGMDGEFRPYIWGGCEAWLNQRVCVFENRREKGKAFLYFSLLPLLHAAESMAIGTTVIHIGKKDFDSFRIVIPPVEILNQFDEVTTPMIKLIVNNMRENQILAHNRDTLLPKLMSGEIDVTEIQS